MAGDIPSQSYASGLAMAKVLVSYIDCPHRVRSAILCEFNTAPALGTIERMRADYLTAKPADIGLRTRPADAYYPHQEGDKLATINERFLMRLEIERAISARANGNALLEQAA